MATRQYKRHAYNVAKALGYLAVYPDIKERIYGATTEREVTRVLITARHMMG